MLYTVARTHAKLLANDPNYNDTDILALFNEVYGAYWESFLKDRVTLVTSFVTFGANQFAAEASTAVREVLDLARSVALPLATTTVGNIIERDEFDAVVADSTVNPDAIPASVYPIRWGSRMKADNSKPIIAVFPPSLGTSFGAYVYPLPNTVSTSSPAGDLQGTDDDGYAVARLVALEVMARNGEDPADIERVFSLFDQKSQSKMQTIRERVKPRPAEGKDQ